MLYWLQLEKEDWKKVEYEKIQRVGHITIDIREKYQY